MCSEEPGSGAAQRHPGSPQSDGNRIDYGGEQVSFSRGGGLQRSDSVLVSADQLSGQRSQVTACREGSKFTLAYPFFYLYVFLYVLNFNSVDLSPVRNRISLRRSSKILD